MDRSSTRLKGQEATGTRASVATKTMRSPMALLPALSDGRAGPPGERTVQKKTWSCQEGGRADSSGGESELGVHTRTFQLAGKSWLEQLKRFRSPRPRSRCSPLPGALFCTDNLLNQADRRGAGGSWPVKGNIPQHVGIAQEADKGSPP